jgi:hypothetical protein
MQRRSVRSRPVAAKDPHADTVVLPADELAIRRVQKRLGQLTPEQIRRLIAAFERKQAQEGERRRANFPRLVEDQPDGWANVLPVPEEFPIG